MAAVPPPTYLKSPHLRCVFGIPMYSLSAQYCTSANSAIEYCTSANSATRVLHKCQSCHTSIAQVPILPSSIAQVPILPSSIAQVPILPRQYCTSANSATLVLHKCQFCHTSIAQVPILPQSIAQVPILPCYQSINRDLGKRNHRRRRLPAIDHQ